MTDGIERVAWSGRRAVVTFPEHVHAQDAARIGEQLLRVLGQGAVTLIADMSSTVHCDPAAVDAVARAYRQAVASQAELRLVISAPEVRRLTAAESLDRLVPVYTSLEAALADGMPNGPEGGQFPGRRTLAPWPAQQQGQEDGQGPRSPVSEVVLRQLIDALDDGVMLADGNGSIVLANRRLTVMFGYQPAELAGQPVEVLVPAGLREAHRADRAAYERKPVARPMADRARLAGARKDGSTVPVTITLAPIPTDGGHLVLAVVRDALHTQQRDDLAVLLSATAAGEAERGRELLDRVVRSLFHVGFSLHAAAAQPADMAREQISEALRRLDDTIHEIRDHVFRTQPPDSLP
jgi:PAS domain S-box-containing protein